MKQKLLFLLMLLMGTSCAEAQQKNNSDDSLLELAQKRRSIRRYTNEKIDRATIDNILKVAMFSPSSYGQNPVEFVVIEDKATLAKLAKCKRIGAPSIAASAATVVVMADTSKGELWVEDASVAASYILLAAEHYGIGACWNQVRLRDGQRLSTSDEIKELLNVPSRFEVLCFIALGHKGEQKAPHTEKELDFGRIHFGNYSGTKK